MKESIRKANQYIDENRKKVNQQYRGAFHLLPPIGWMNDPNGFVYFRGEYHLFYQFYPYDSVWGPMHWGHAKSKDLLHWEELPVALAPSESYDKDGCFSGSAIVKDDKLYLLYTGHVDDEEKREETQCLAVSTDGITFEKLPTNPVIHARHIEGIADIADFRDPKVFEYQGSYYAVIASKTPDDRGQILLFASSNLVDWAFTSVLLEGEKGQGIMWECPDFFPLDGKWVLILSPIEMERQQEKYWNLNSTVAFIGDMNWETGHFRVDSYDEMDGGLDFYAPQTCQGPNGERYMVAWMQMWHRSIPSHDLAHGWAGSMTLPRKLSLKDGRLVQELPESVKEHFLVENFLETIVKGNQIIISAKGKQTLFELDAKPGRSFILGYGDETDPDSVLQLVYDASQKRFSLSRDQFGHPISGKENPAFQSRWIQLDAEKDHHFSIIRDTNSIEVFVDGKTLSMTFYETSQNPVYTLTADEGIDWVVKTYQK